jgi:hypothetical protein
LEEALDAARKIGSPAGVVDSSLDAYTASNPLAFAMGARLIRLDDLSREALLDIFPQAT